MRQLILMFFGLLLTIRVFGQEISDSIPQGTGESGIFEDLQITQDPKIENMVHWHVENNKAKNGLDGFRIEIFSSSQVTAKEKALARKVEFISEYPEIPVTILFISPNFKVRVGDFRTKNEALKIYKAIQTDYPSAFIVQDKIDFPMLKASQYE